MAPKLVVFHSWKKVQVLEKNVSRKKQSVQLICVDVIFKTVRENVFWNKWVSRYLTFGDFRFRKIVPLHKIINKTLWTKKKENSAHLFGNTYLTDHLVKFLKDRIKSWRVAGLRLCAGYHFFWQKLLVRAFQPPLTFSVVHVNRQS